MAFLAIDQIDDFLEAVMHKYVKRDWKDISLPFQKYYFASRIFSKASSDEMEGDQVTWKLQVNNPGNAQVTGLYAVDKANRVDLLTHGSMPWAIMDVKYTYDILESVFRSNKVQILNYIDVQEHAMYNDFMRLMEDLMFGAGWSSPSQNPRPPASLLWWIQPYNTATGQPNNSATYQLPAGTNSGFLGMDPPGFSSVGAGNILSSTYAGWRNRVGQYSVFSQEDAIDTIVECMDKCMFTPAQSYAELAPGSKPEWELLTTYSRLKLARRLADIANDNIGNDLTAYKGTVLINGVPLRWVPAWSNSTSVNQRTDGIILGVNWSTFKYYGASGVRMMKTPPFRDATKSNVRWRKMTDSGQIVCFDRRANFAVNCTATVTEQD